jgi:predicted NodU family carbamoyl transferase
MFEKEKEIEQLKKSRLLLSEKIDLLAKKIDEKDFKKTIISQENKKDLIASLKSEIKNTASIDILNEIKEKMRKLEKETIENEKHQEVSDTITKIFNRSFERFKDTINDQYKRGNLNLIIGIFITIIGLIISINHHPC